MEWYTWVVFGVLFVLYTWAVYAVANDRGNMSALRWLDKQLMVSQTKELRKRTKYCRCGHCDSHVEIHRLRVAAGEIEA